MKRILIALSLFMFGFALIACGGGDNESEVSGTEVETGGVTQEDYDDLRAELEALQAENERLREEALVEDTEEHTEAEPTETADTGGLVSFDSTFMFRDFEIEIGSADDVIWRTVENSRNDYFGNDVVGIPVTMTNFSGETGRLNSFSYKFFGSEGTQLSSVIGHSDYHIWDQGDMRHEASQEGFFMLMYDGDGDYIIEFSSPGEDTIEVVLPINK